MSSAPNRVRSATGPVALVVALMALLASAAGIGYAAATIGTNDIQDGAVTAAKIKKNAVTGKKVKKNAVTGTKVKNGSLQPGDLAKQERQRKPTLGNGGEGDCAWQPFTTEIPGSGTPTFRKDRNGRVILTGIAKPVDAPGGDANCDPTAMGQVADGIVFRLPAGYMPAKTQFRIGLGGELIIAGPSGFVTPTRTLPPGAVFTSTVALLDGIAFDPAGSDVVVARVKASGRWTSLVDAAQQD
jgi:hypothetical protein